MAGRGRHPAVVRRVALAVSAVSLFATAYAGDAALLRLCAVSIVGSPNAAS